MSSEELEEALNHKLIQKAVQLERKFSTQEIKNKHQRIKSSEKIEDQVQEAEAQGMQQTISQKSLVIENDFAQRQQQNSQNTNRNQDHTDEFRIWNILKLIYLMVNIYYKYDRETRRTNLLLLAIFWVTRVAEIYGVLRIL